MLSWAFRNPARMRLEIQPDFWIGVLEQPKIDTLKGQDTLFAFSLGYNPHPDNITCWEEQSLHILYRDCFSSFMNYHNI